MKSKVLSSKLLVVNFIIIAFAIITFIALQLTVSAHGGEIIFKYNLSTIRHSIKHSFVETKIKPDELKDGDIVIFYRFGCKDCEATYLDILNYIEDNDVQDVHFVATRSHSGKKILRKYPVPKVPSAIVLMDGSYRTKVIYTEKDNGDAVLDIDAMNRVLELQSIACK